MQQAVLALTKLPARGQVSLSLVYDKIEVGAKIELTGLASRAELNGMVGTVEAQLASGRWVSDFRGGVAHFE